MNEMTCGRGAGIADFQSAVSRISNPEGMENFGDTNYTTNPADGKPAIQQIGNLRYIQIKL